MESAPEAVPLSFAQQRLWFIHQLNPELPVYNIPLAIRLNGKLEVPILERALREIVNRHGVLRTVIHSVQGDPYQETLGRFDLPLPVSDLSRSQNTETQESAIQNALSDEARRPFDLSTDLPIRVRLFKVAGNEHLLTVVMHHVAADGWSLGVLFRELTLLYNAFSSGHDSPLQDVPVQYCDYAIWQRQFLQGQDLQSLIAYWRKQLTDAPTLELPTDKRRPPMQSFDGRTIHTSFPSDLTRELKALSQREGVTLFTTLLAAFNVLLSRYADQDDVVVGSPIAGRDLVEVEDLIGCFVNTLVLRNDLSGNPTFRELLHRVHDVAMDAYDHQELPFEKLVEELQPARDTSRNAFFQVLFSLQNTPRAETSLVGMVAERVNMTTDTAKCDLTVAALESNDEIAVRFTYNVDLFHESTVTRMASCWKTLLATIAKDGHQPIADLPLINSEECAQIVVNFNDTATAFPRDKTVQTLFEEQVLASPNAVAVSSDGDHLSYGELNEQANRLAHVLLKRGVKPQVPVAVCLDRGPDFIVTLLAIVKCGAIYVPLDPDYPSDRIGFMLEDSEARVIVTDRDFTASISEQPVDVVDLAQDHKVINRAATRNPTCEVGGEDLAYVMYTSGSTGKPKGTSIPHRAIIRLVKETDYVQLDPSDVVAQASNCSFDAATFEIWGALLNGSRLEVVSQDTLVKPEELAEKIGSTGITTLFITTALFNQIVEQAPDTFGKLRHLLFGGEAVTPRLVRQLLSHDPPERLLHVYGPTETTTFATWYEVRRVPASATTVPIGRPIANTTVYILDRRQNPVPIGLPGEIYIGGDGVGVGYRNREELSQRYFIPDPFEDRPKAQLYRTGDLGRWLPDGNVEFVGRIDGQVKLRGFRIEPGEIEHTLLRHPEINTCIVTTHDAPRTGKQLVAYYVEEPNTKPTVRALRSFLRSTLPDYMLPSAFVAVEQMPLTPNGKIDRQALPKPTVDSTRSQQTYVGPRNKVEVKLASIWSQTMGVERVSLHDDFFELGGHSLLAVRMFSQIEREFGVALPLATLFETPTLGALARLLKNKELPATSQSPLVAVQPRGSRPPFFAIHAAGGHAIFYRKVALEMGPDQPFYAVETVRRRPGDLPTRKIETMASDYLVAIRELQPSGPYYLGGYSAGGNIALEIAQQLLQSGERVALLAIFDSVLLRLWADSVPLGRRIYGFGHNIVRKLRRPIYDLSYSLWGRVGIRIPISVKTAVLRDSIRTAARVYTPQPYPNRITYFRATQGRSNVTQGWIDIAKGGLEIHDVETNHGDMFGKNHKLLAPLLKACLEEAQATFEFSGPQRGSAAA